MSRVRPPQPTMQGPRGVLCPYCGVVSLNPKRCDRCGGHFDPLSRQAILAGCVIAGIPMFGDYFTQTLLASTRQTSMFGNLIVKGFRGQLL